MFNENPTVYVSRRPVRKSRFETGQSIWVDGDEEEDENNTSEVEPIDQEEIFDLIRSIWDPEHPNTLEELRVVSAEQIEVEEGRVLVEFTPTVPHCGMSPLIGLCIRVRLLRSLPPRFKIDIRVKPGSHATELAVNKQLNDKERIAAALENPRVLESVEKCLIATGTSNGV